MNIEHALRESPARFEIGGVFGSSVMRHRDAQLAIEQEDPEKLSWARRFAFTNGLYISKKDYVEVDEELTHNLIPNKGLEFVLNLLFHTRGKVTTWYHGPFITAWTPQATAQANWAVDPLITVTELSEAQFVGSNRQAAVFSTAASNGTISSSAATAITIAEGVENISVYGTTLNSSLVVNESNQGTNVLLAATAFAAHKSGLGAADVLNLSYTLTVNSI